MAAMAIRPARPAEAEALSELAVRSKGHWGYDDQFLEACRAELRVTQARCDGTHVLVAERDGKLVGFSELSGEPPAGALDKLYVDPAAIGIGVGGQLLQEAREQACRLGFAWLTVDADPNAEGFYVRFGARRIGSVPSGSIPGRWLPQLRWDLLADKA
jgi:GNAT superfamily N-acetyltransferase